MRYSKSTPGLNHVRNSLRRIIILIFVALTACDKDEITEPLPPPTIESILPTAGVPKMTVKITGNNFSTKASDNDVKFNGVKAIVLSAEVNELLVEVPSDGSTGLVTVTVGSESIAGPAFRYYDVYILINEVGSNKNSIIKAWRNEKLETLTNLSISSTANSFTVSGNDIYVAGYIFDGIKTTPAYWINKIAYPLSPNNIGLATDIAVNGTDTHICGSEFIGTHYVAKYWKNGIGINLTEGLYANDIANTIAIANNNDVYVGGTEINSNNIGAGTYWKNGGNETRFGDEQINSVIYDIKVVGSDVYVLGQNFYRDDNIGTISVWKNGVLKDLTDRTHYAWAGSMTIYENKLYIVGFENNDANKQVPKLWIDDTVKILFDGTGSVSNIVVIDGDVFVAGQKTVGQAEEVFYSINDAVFKVISSNADIKVVGLYVR